MSYCSLGNPPNIPSTLYAFYAFYFEPHPIPHTPTHHQLLTEEALEVCHDLKKGSCGIIIVRYETQDVCALCQVNLNDTPQKKHTLKSEKDQ